MSYSSKKKKNSSLHFLLMILLNYSIAFVLPNSFLNESIVNFSDFFDYCKYKKHILEVTSLTNSLITTF